jgi:hypothetical protein
MGHRENVAIRRNGSLKEVLHKRDRLWLSELGTAGGAWTGKPRDVAVLLVVGTRAGG